MEISGSRKLPELHSPVVGPRVTKCSDVLSLTTAPAGWEWSATHRPASHLPSGLGFRDTCSGPLVVSSLRWCVKVSEQSGEAAGEGKEESRQVFERGKVRARGGACRIHGPGRRAAGILAQSLKASIQRRRGGPHVPGCLRRPGCARSRLKRCCCPGRSLSAAGRAHPRTPHPPSPLGEEPPASGTGQGGCDGGRKRVSSAPCLLLFPPAPGNPSSLGAHSPPL